MHGLIVHTDIDFHVRSEVKEVTVELCITAAITDNRRDSQCRHNIDTGYVYTVQSHKHPTDAVRFKTDVIIT